MSVFFGSMRPPRPRRRHSHGPRQLEPGTPLGDWNAANDPIAILRAAIDSGERTITPFLAGMHGPDLPGYTTEMDRAVNEEGYGVQRHGGEQWGYEGFMPMLIKKDKSVAKK